jgi:predicted ArsR family transcriptional regulator
MHDRRRLALDALRLHGGLTLNELCRELRLTRTAAANRLAQLRAEGLVVEAGLRPGKRRPSVVYALAPEADRVFPQAYERMAVDLLDEISRRGARYLRQILQRVGRRWIARDAEALQKLPRHARIEAGTKVLAARGFMPALEAGATSYTLRNHNCPIARVCGAHHEAADMVKQWIEALYGTPVQRSSCICLGARYCEYTVRRKLRRA